MHLAPLEQVSRLNMHAARAAIDKSSTYSFNFTAAAKDTGLLLDKASGKRQAHSRTRPRCPWGRTGGAQTVPSSHMSFAPPRPDDEAVAPMAGNLRQGGRPCDTSTALCCSCALCARIMLFDREFMITFVTVCTRARARAYKLRTRQLAAAV